MLTTLIFWKQIESSLNSLNVRDTVVRSYGMGISSEKSKGMVTSRINDRREDIVKADDVDLEEVNKLQYLVSFSTGDL